MEITLESQVIKSLKNKTVLLAFVSILLLSACLPVSIVPTQAIRPDNIIVATVGEPWTVDPACAYDTASGELIFNVYDTLVFFYVNRTLPCAEQGRTDVIVPSLATEWSVEDISETDSDTGLTWVQRWYFKIRKTFTNASGTFPVKFHNGANLTCEDVEYSFERCMVECPFGGPTWMILEPLLDVWEIRPNYPSSNATLNALMIKHAIESNSTHVWFNLVKPFTPFLSLLAQPWSSNVLNKDWCIAHGDWPGTYGTPIDAGANWTLWNNPEASPLDYPEPVMCGTGPYVFDYWDKGVEWSLYRNVDYWGGWPAEGCNGYVERVTEKFVSEWPMRKLLFLAGDVDFCYIPKQYDSEVEGLPGVRCIEDLPTLVFGTIFFNFAIASNVFIGSGQLDGNGIPPNFFSDIDVREGFAYSFNYTKYIEDVYPGEATQPSSPVIKGLPYWNPYQAKYSINLTKAEEHFKRAWGGQVWTNGFEFSAVCFYCHEARRKALEILIANVESLNPKFHIHITDPFQYLQIYIPPEEWPLYPMGWFSDIPDPHYNVYEFMHSDGNVARVLGYRNETVDVLIEEAMKTVNTTRRHEIYYELQSIYHNDCLGIPIYQSSTHHWERTWVQGWYYNPAYPGSYFYHYWKDYSSMEPVDVSVW
jgi:peptide/nickel transport system substrate-binding protein